MWIRHLPSDSALVARGVAGDDRWGMNEHILAAVLDTLGYLDYHLLAVNGNKSAKAPKPVERPDMQFNLED